MKKTLGEKLRKARQKIELTQGELGALIYTTHCTISDYENNKKEPKLSRLIELCKILKIDIKDLL